MATLTASFRRVSSSFVRLSRRSCKSIQQNDECRGSWWHECSTQASDPYPQLLEFDLSIRATQPLHSCQEKKLL